VKSAFIARSSHRPSSIINLSYTTTSDINMMNNVDGWHGAGLRVDGWHGSPASSTSSVATSCGGDSASTVAHQVGDQQLMMAIFKLARFISSPTLSTACSWSKPFVDAQMNACDPWKCPLQRLRTRKGCFWDSGEWAISQGAATGEQPNIHKKICLWIHQRDLNNVLLEGSGNCQFGHPVHGDNWCSLQAVAVTPADTQPLHPALCW
jgi:hypothetical protein